MAARRTREPLRTCVGCRRVRPKHELVRIVLAPQGKAVVDATGGAAGRGAYVCPERTCLDRASGRLGGALRGGNIDFTELGRDLSAVTAV